MLTDVGSRSQAAPVERGRSAMKRSGSRARVVVADDLSGAAELAGVLHGVGLAATIVLDGRPSPRGVSAVDLHVRDEPGPRALDVAQGAVGTWDVRYVKIDSLLRGPVRAIVKGCSAGTRRVIVCSALPSAGRTIVGGVPFLHGEPLQRSDAWRAEPTTPPASMRELLAPLAAAEPSDAPSLPAGAVLVADASTDADLDCVAALVEEGDLLPVGSAGLFGALVRRGAFGFGDERPGQAPGIADGRTGGVAIVVGTTSDAARAQIEALERAGALIAAMDPDDDRAGIPGAARAAIEAGGRVVLCWNRAAEVDAARAASLTERLADHALQGLGDDDRVSLVLTGGRTARAVLERLAVPNMCVAGVVHHGAVIARTAAGRLVGVRPGGFGGPDSLLEMANAVQPEPRREQL